jgi:hypothetical protein
MSGEAVVYIKVQEYTDGLGAVKKVVGVCDRELLGKVFVSGDVRLVVNEEFFKGVEASIDEALEQLKIAYTAMIVGEKIVGEAVKAGIIHPEAVSRVEGIPYAQLVRM